MQDLQVIPKSCPVTKNSKAKPFAGETTSDWQEIAMP